MTPRSVRLDPVFRELADPTRRAVLDRLARGPAAVSDLAKPYAMALPSFLQHLKMLEDCGLVRSRKAGRVRTYRLVPERLRQAEGWLAGQRSRWERRMNQLDDYLAHQQQGARYTTAIPPRPISSNIWYRSIRSGCGMS